MNLFRVSVTSLVPLLGVRAASSHTLSKPHYCLGAMDLLWYPKFFFNSPNQSKAWLFFSHQICGNYACFAKSSTAKHHFLLRKISSAAPPWGTWLRTHYWGIEREEKSPAPGGSWVQKICSEGVCSTVLLKPLLKEIWLESENLEPIRQHKKDPRC